MAGRNAWAMLRNSILNGGAFDPAAASGADEFDLQNESPWARAVREGWETQLRRDPIGWEPVAPSEPPQPAFGAPISGALWPPFPAHGDLGGGPMPSSPLLSQADISTLPPPPRGAPPFASDFGPSQQPSGMSAGTRMVQLGSLPGASPFDRSMPVTPTPVGYADTVRPRPWPPGIFDPWAEHFIKGIQGLLNSGSRPTAGDPSAPGCKEEWDEARKLCAGWLASPNPPRGASGGYKNIEDCARGLVSERCGGNPYARPRRPNTRPWRPPDS